MLATFTLQTTSFAASVGPSDTLVNLVSMTGVVPGIMFYANREAFKVTALTGIGNNVTVLRGRNGTATRSHSTNETVYVAPGYQFFEVDPQGTLGPGEVPLANPYINILNGTVWVTVGDDAGPDVGARTWQLVTTTPAVGALGVRQNVVTTPS